jgi:hypothetical protein
MHFDASVVFVTNSSLLFRLALTILWARIDFISDMNEYGSFSYSDYDVMDRSCNTFTYELSKRLHLSEKYPVGILNQSKMGELLAPVVHAIDILGCFIWLLSRKYLIKGRRRNLFSKIKVRHRSCRSYPIWRP